MSLSPDALKVLNDFGNEPGVTKCHVDQLPEALQLTSAPDATSVAATPAHNGRFMIGRPLYTLLATLALGACAHTAATPAPATVTETSAMSFSADHVPADLSKGGPRAAQEALERVLELIRTSASIESFTADHVSGAMGQSVEHRDDVSGRFSASGVLTRDWNYGFGVNKTEVKGAWFEFLFLPNPPEASPSMEGLINSPQMRDTTVSCRGLIHAAD
ncbi:hypothetical protein, partial [Xanthomonas citri]